MSGAELYRVRRSRLEGRVEVSGAKNSVLRLLAASLLTREPITLDNYPAGLLDAQVHVGMLEALGKRCGAEGATLTIEEALPPPSALDWEGRSIRNTLLILGALVARTGDGAVPVPGGCRLGERKYDLHEMILRELGARVYVDEKDRLAAEAPNGLRGADIHLPLRSTGATENGILMGALAHGTTRIWNPHVRPEILDLVAFLRSMGAEIEVHGQEHIAVHGRPELAGTRHRVIADNMEALTWMIGAVITGGDVEIVGFPADDLEVPLIHLRESGVQFFLGANSVIVRGGRPLPVEISTGPYPGINSDMQPLFAVFGACARGTSKIVDLRFPGRYGYADEMNRMGAHMRVEGDTLVIQGGHPWHGADVTALDLRAGVALTLAGMVSDGETRVHDAWQVERGYDRFVAKANALGGHLDAVPKVEA
jgi:UDP-N-acetylglucosamine 1-carboxyvinyltransferase